MNNVEVKFHYYPLSIGRNMQEIKRLIIAMQKGDKEEIVNPAN
jgi:peroxiredoxin (alkyl hydroperoxide reductase subunit C)